MSVQEFETVPPCYNLSWRNTADSSAGPCLGACFLRQVHDEGPGVKDLPGHWHGVQPVRGVEAVVGGHRWSHIGHIHRVIVIVVEYLKLIRVGVAVKLKDQGQ